MNAQILSFFRPAPVAQGDWSQQELAEFYRVEAATIQAGLRLVTDRGLTDEGDPWFVFCRADDGEVFIHFARYDGLYVIAADALDGVLQGSNFRALLSEFTARNPAFLPVPRQTSGATLLMHPAALLAAIVATACLLGSGQEAVAGELNPGGDHPPDRAAAGSGPDGHEAVGLIGSGLQNSADDHEIRRAQSARQAEMAGTIMAAATIALALSREIEGDLHAPADPLVRGSTTAGEHGQTTAPVEVHAEHHDDGRPALEGANAGSVNGAQTVTLGGAPWRNGPIEVRGPLASTDFQTAPQIPASPGPLEVVPSHEGSLVTTLLGRGDGRGLTGGPGVSTGHSVAATVATAANPASGEASSAASTARADTSTASGRSGGGSGASLGEDSAASSHHAGQELAPSTSPVGAKSGLTATVPASDTGAGHAGSDPLSPSSLSAQSMHGDNLSAGTNSALIALPKTLGSALLSEATETLQAYGVKGSGSSPAVAAASPSNDGHAGAGVDAGSQLPSGLATSTLPVWTNLISQITTLQRADTHGSGGVSETLAAAITGTGVGHEAATVAASVTPILEAAGSHQASAAATGIGTAPVASATGLAQGETGGSGSIQVVSGSTGLVTQAGTAHPTMSQDTVLVSGGGVSADGGHGANATAGATAGASSAVLSGAIGTTAPAHASPADAASGLVSTAVATVDATHTAGATAGAAGVQVSVTASSSTGTGSATEATAAGTTSGSGAGATIPSDLTTLHDAFFQPLTLDQVKLIDAFISSSNHLRLDLVERTLIMYDSEPQAGLTVPVTSWDLGHNVTLSLVGIPDTPTAAHSL